MLVELGSLHRSWGGGLLSDLGGSPPEPSLVGGCPPGASWLDGRPPLSVSRRSKHTVVAYKDAIYVFGGDNG